MQLTREDIKKEALLLARENKKAEPRIQAIYWFPNDSEVRLVELDPFAPKTLSGAVEPFYFAAAPNYELPAPSGIAMIRPDEMGQLTLPEEWGSWDNAEQLEIEE